MVNILQINILAMYFLYGLSFYTMGVAIALQYRSYSSFRLANSLSLLAAFALLHGLSEWGTVFMPIGLPNLGVFPLWKLIAIQRLMQAVSYYFLFLFGVKLISDTRKQNFFVWSVLPTVAFIGWFIHFVGFIPLVGTPGLYTMFLDSESISRYVLAFPAGLFTACGLALQVGEVKKIEDNAVMRNLWMATFSFTLFALFSGLVVPQKVGWLGGMINNDSFRGVTYLPIELFRTAAALLSTWSITRMLGIFDLERQRQGAEVKRVEAVYQERERFARDLHDDVIQAIFAIGLDLQTTSNRLRNDNLGASEHIFSAVGRLNQVIHALRGYIQDLESNRKHQDLKTSIITIINQVKEKTGLDIRFDIQLTKNINLLPSQELDDSEQQIRQIIREALNNITKHAEATKAEVKVYPNGKRLFVEVKDNGRGLPVERPLQASEGLGMRNMRNRAALIGGKMQVYSKPGEGTEVVVDIPIV